MTLFVLVLFIALCAFSLGFVSGKACERMQQDGIGEADEYKVGGSE